MGVAWQAQLHEIMHSKKLGGTTKSYSTMHTSAQEVPLNLEVPLSLEPGALAPALVAEEATSEPATTAQEHPNPTSQRTFRTHMATFMASNVRTTAYTSVGAPHLMCGSGHTGQVVDMQVLGRGVTTLRS